MSEPVSFASWRDVVTALRHRDQRLLATLSIIAVAEAYLLCLAAAALTACAVYAWAIQPVLNVLFSRIPNPTVVQLATGGVVGAPLFWVNVRLMYRVANRWPVVSKGRTNA